MLIKMNWTLHKDYIVLGSDKIPGQTIKGILDKVKHFAPKNAKSYTIWNVYSYSNRYNSKIQEVCFNVSYYTTVKEGKNAIRK